MNPLSRNPGSAPDKRTLRTLPWARTQYTGCLHCSGEKSGRNEPRHEKTTKLAVQQAQALADQGVL